MMKLIDYEKSKGLTLEGRLAAFEDTALDALAATQKPVKPPKARQEALEKCPSCGLPRILYRGYYARICTDCHVGISVSAKRMRDFE